MRLPLALVLPLAALVCGCDFVNQIGPSSCDRSAPGDEVSDKGALLYTEGAVEDGVYATSEPDGDLLFFPGGIRYRIKHQLGVAPTWWQIYLSFGEHGTRDGEDEDEFGENTLAQASGNQAEVILVNDTDLVVVNGSCSDYWVLVVAGTGTPP